MELGFLLFCSVLFFLPLIQTEIRTNYDSYVGSLVVFIEENIRFKL